MQTQNNNSLVAADPMVETSSSPTLTNGVLGNVTWPDAP
jgi:hypothetical protein